MSTAPDTLILGGGVIGLTTAYYLRRAGAAVEVLDQSDFGREASWAGAGILPPGNPDRTRTPVERLRATGAALFPSLSAELRAATGIDNGYRRCGGLEFVEGPLGELEEEWRAEGIAFERVNEAQVRRLEPALAAGVGPAYHFPDMAQVRNPRHLQALVAWCRQHGVRLRPGTPAEAVRHQAGRVTGVTTPAGEISADNYLLAAGAWTDRLLGPLGWRPGVRPVRGQIALFNLGTPLLARILLRGKCYLVPRADGRVLAGSTEEDAGFDKRTTPEGVAGLVAFARSLVPRLADAPPEQSWAGLRPGSPDGLPFLGGVPGFDNLYVAAGHFRAGIQLSPGTGQVMADLLLGRPPSLPLDAFRPDRPPGPPPRLAFRS
jgi:glycine oxidase